jgi:hypothetical protein
MDCLPLD